MNVTKLGTGKYRIRETKNGKNYSVNVDHKPTQKEARELLDALQREDPILSDNASLTFREAYEGFISARSSILSPSTIKGYRTAFRGLPEWFTQMPLRRIDRTHVQKVVNDYSATHSPKTVKNQHGLISAVMHFYECRECPVTLPQARKADIYIPTQEDVARLLKACRGSKYEVPIRLGIYGLRRSETLALEPGDLSDDNVLTINKAKVEGIDGSVVKSTKTSDSTGTIVLDQELADLIRQQGFYTGSASRLTMALSTIEEMAGLPHFSYHKLRHFFASYAHAMGCTPKQIQSIGRWKTPHVMETVYTHAMETEEAKRNMAGLIGQITSQI